MCVLNNIKQEYVLLNDIKQEYNLLRESFEAFGETIDFYINEAEKQSTETDKPEPEVSALSPQEQADANKLIECVVDQAQHLSPEELRQLACQIAAAYPHSVAHRLVL